LLFLLNAASREGTNTNCIFFGLTHPGLTVLIAVEPEAPKKQTTKKDQSSSNTMEVDS
jgi:hypothetical protein